MEPPQSRSLQAHLEKAAITLTRKHDLDARLRSAAHIATKYKFGPPELVLLLLHPELRKKPWHERATLLGFTEEQLFPLMQQPGFQQFLKAVKLWHQDGIQVQSLEKLEEAIGTTRTITARDGSTSEDFTLESATMQAWSQSQQPARAEHPINISMNLFDRARARVLEVVDVPAAGTGSESPDAPDVGVPGSTV